MDVVVFIVRNVISHGQSRGGTLESTRRRLRSDFAKDPKRSRQLVWHAAQIVAVANEYLVSAPCEIMRLFMGYIFIIAYVEHTSQASQNLSNPVRLDLPNHQMAQRHSINEWIRNGGPASIGSVDNVYSKGCAATLSQDAQSMLQRLHCWGLAEKFTKILQAWGSNGF
jgi:hypothetical protein